MFLRSLAALSLTVSAFANGSVSHTVTLPPIHAPNPTTFQVQGFDRILGRLTSVTWVASIAASGSIGVENTDPNFDMNQTVQFGAGVSVSNQNGGIVGLAVAYQDLAVALQPYDGTTDYAGASGAMLPFASNDTWTTTYATSWFTLPTYLVPVVTLSVQTWATFFPAWPSSAPDVWSNVTLTVTYNYADYPELFCAQESNRCPCGSALGYPIPTGCPSSTSTHGASLWTPDAAPFTLGSPLGLQVDDMPPNAFALAFEGSGASYSGFTFGDGLRCATGAMRRLSVQQASAGHAYFPVHGGGLGYRTYQVWYRDPGVYCTPALYNLTNALGVVWTP